MFKQGYQKHNTLLFSLRTMKQVTTLNNLSIMSSLGRNYVTLFGAPKTEKKMPVWFPIYRMIFKLHRETFPPSQLEETNRMMREIFRDYIHRYRKECSSFEEQEILLEEAKERAVSYIENLRKMSFGGSEKLELHSIDFWDR